MHPEKQKDSSKQAVRIGIDIGGTFTDFVIYNSESQEIETFKVLSTPSDPAQAVISGLRDYFHSRSSDLSSEILDVVHGSTVATNALLERKGARTALITTQGFQDILQIGRQNRPSLYDLSIEPPPALIPARLSFGVEERVDHKGEVLIPLNTQQVDQIISEINSQGVTSVAICLLFSFLYPDHEKVISQKLRASGFFASASSEILPEYREYERMSTTAVNAYVSPVLDRYLAHLDQALVQKNDNASGHLRVMQSNGGNISVQEARRNGVRCILSGPAGGIVGAQYLAEKASTLSHEMQGAKFITFDMGGTSTDVSLIDEKPQITTESIVGGCPIRIPVLDIHTIGAGGGSIASVDLGGVLRVGPESAGANPGPACYGLGDYPTVTDANLVLGRIIPEHFLDGQLVLDPSRSWKALDRIGEQLGLSPVEAALGIVEIVNAHMERALRVISVERGYDPRDFVLISFGGAGGLHAASLSKSLGIHRVLIPPIASTLSAFGMLAADVVKDYTKTVMMDGNTPAESISAALEPLVSIGISEVLNEGIASNQISVNRLLDMRYQRLDTTLEIVNLRVQVVGKVNPPHLRYLRSQPITEMPGNPKEHDIRKVYFTENQENIPVYRGELLHPGNSFSGPALIVRSDTTVLVPKGDRVNVDNYENIKMEIGYAH
jgi:N-methylhydantoinase A